MIISKEVRVLRIALIVMWLATTGAMVLLLLQGVRRADQFNVLHYVLPGIYTLVLVWYLWRTGQSMKALPELRSPIFPQRQFGRIIPAVIVALVFALHFFSDLGILLLMSIVAIVWIILAWWRNISVRLVITGFLLATFAFVSGYLYFKHDFISSAVFFLLVVLSPLMVIAGGLLIIKTGLNNFALLSGNCVKALKSFLWGCLLFVPLGLTNAASGSPGGNLNWLTSWWMPFSLPVYSGIVEEAWYRLLVVSLCYFMLRPALRRYPQIAMMGAVVFSAVTFGLGHGLSLHNFLTTGLLYGLPMAVIFARRDWEHAVGTHYMVNFVPVAIVFLETSSM
jgi:hypothetical protein